MNKNIVLKALIIIIFSILICLVMPAKVSAKPGEVSIDNVIKDTQVYARDGTVLCELKAGINNIEVEDDATWIDAIGASTHKLIGQVTTSTGETISGDTGEYYIPTTALRSSEAEGTYDPDEESSGSSSGGYGSSGAYGTGTVVVNTNDTAGRGGGGLDDLSQESSLDQHKSTGVTGASTLSARSNIIVGILQAVGTVISVIMLTVLAIKYMISSVEERAEFKETMVPFVIGAGSLLIISNLVGIIYSIIENINV